MPELTSVPEFPEAITPRGPKGDPGSQLILTKGPPSVLQGVNGDHAFDPDTGRWYSKANGVWDGGNLVGPIRAAQTFADRARFDANMAANSASSAAISAGLADEDRIAALAARTDALAARNEALAAANSVSLQHVSSMAALRALPPVDGRIRFLTRYYSDQEGGSGFYRGVTGAEPGTYTHNGGTIIVEEDGDGSSAHLLIHNGLVTDRQFGARSRGQIGDAAIDTDAWRRWILAASAQRFKGFGEGGTPMITRIDVTLTDDLDIWLQNDCIWRGVKNWQRFPGGTGATSLTITEFDYAASGINVELYEDANPVHVDANFRTNNTHFVQTGQGINLAAGSSAMGAVPEGYSLNVTSTQAMITLRRSGAADRLDWKGGYADNSQRGFALARASGTALRLIGWNNGAVSYGRWIGPAGGYLASRAGRLSDTAVTFNDCKNMQFTHNYVANQGDLGVYATGGASPGPQDNGGQITVSLNVFQGCSGGVKAIRAYEGMIANANWFLQCGSFCIMNAPAGVGFESGVNYSITNNVALMCGRRIFDLRAMAEGSTILGNRIEDFGFFPDGTTPFALLSGDVDASPIAIFLAGAQTALVSLNRVSMRRWVGNNNQIGILVNATTFADGSPAISRNVRIRDNFIRGIPIGIRESGDPETIADDIVNNRYEDNTIENCATPILILSPSTRWSWIDGVTGDKWESIGAKPARLSGSFILLKETSTAGDPPPPGFAAFYVNRSGSKLRAILRFPTGAPIVLAEEP